MFLENIKLLWKLHCTAAPSCVHRVKYHYLKFGRCVFINRNTCSYTSLYKTFVELITVCFQKIFEQCLTQTYFLKADFLSLFVTGMHQDCMYC